MAEGFHHNEAVLNSLFGTWEELQEQPKEAFKQQLAHKRATEVSKNSGANSNAIDSALREAQEAALEAGFVGFETTRYFSPTDEIVDDWGDEERYKRA